MSRTEWREHFGVLAECEEAKAVTEQEYWAEVEELLIERFEDLAAEQGCEDLA